MNEPSVPPPPPPAEPPAKQGLSTGAKIATGGNLTASAGGRTVNIALATREGETQGLVAYSEKE